MSLKIRMAEIQDEESLGRIMRKNGMDLVSGIEDHVVIADANEVWGGALLYQMDECQFHLLTIAVRDNNRSRGLGSALIGSILKNPWQCCRDSVADNNPHFRVTTVSRGESRGFYRKNGFSECCFSDLFSPFDEQCLSCPDAVTCNSAALAYNGPPMPRTVSPERGFS